MDDDEVYFLYGMLAGGVIVGLLIALARVIATM
jgi:hypothetical protein